MDNKERRKRIIAGRRKNHNQIICMMFFGLIILLLLASLIQKDKSYSESENRNLTQMPKISAKTIKDGSYFSDLSDYVADQFFSRDTWISLKLVEDRLLGRKDAGGCFLGKKGYLLANPDTPDEEALANTEEAINAFVEQFSDLNYDIMIAPAAANVITQYLPKNAPVHDQIADIEAIYDALDVNVQTIDVGTALSEHASEYIYYKTDHHWTSLGAYYAFTNAADALDIETPITDYQTYTVAEDFQGTLSSKSGSHRAKDTVNLYVPKSTVSYYVYYPDSETKVATMYSSDALETKDKYTVFFGGNHPLVEVDTTADTQRNLLIFKDSYANSFIQFLTPYFDKIILVDPRYYYDSVDTVINSYGITDVLFLYSGNTFVTDTSLADVLNAAVNDATAEGSLEDAGMTVDGTEETTDTSEGDGTEETTDTTEETTDTSEETTDTTEETTDTQ